MSFTVYSAWANFRVFESLPSATSQSVSFIGSHVLFIGVANSLQCKMLSMVVHKGHKVGVNI